MAKTKKTAASSKKNDIVKVGFGSYQRGTNVDFTRLYLNKALLRKMLKADDKQYDNLIINLFPGDRSVQATAVVK